MNRVSFIGQMIEFNKRVLYQGMVNPKLAFKYTMRDLKRLLFFNRVFKSNMDEMFMKYDMKEFANSYISMLKMYNANIESIINIMMTIDRSIKFVVESTFESRLLADTMIYDQIINSKYRIGDMESNIYNFENGKIYYISNLMPDMNNIIGISYIDSRRSAYNRILKYDQDDVQMYIHNDQAILDYVRRRDILHDTQNNDIAVRITTDTNGSTIKKVECSGYVDEDMMKILTSIFPKSALIIKCRWIYTDDILRIIDSKITSVPIVKQKYRSILFNDIFNKDMLIEYPKDSFDAFLDILNSAAEDNTVEKISITLYRIGSDPSIYYILRKAISNGISVHVNIELRASGEDINYVWYEEMDRIGINVTNYIASGKVHSKLMLIEFKNGNYIAQIGTGNYHTETTSQYTDLSLITSDKDICMQIKKLFLIFDDCEYEDMYPFCGDLLVTGYNFRDTIAKLIKSESNKGPNGYISMKCNALDDDIIIRMLNNAAQRGCKIDLIVRGVCTWIPEQLGRNVTIKSVIWDKLEHSRVYCFGTTNPTIYIGSLDMVKNKINNRVETLVLIKDPDIAVRICNYMARYITNTKNSWIQTISGMYIKE